MLERPSMLSGDGRTALELAVPFQRVAATTAILTETSLLLMMHLLKLTIETNNFNYVYGTNNK
jgi:hypothetical protein